MTPQEAIQIAQTERDAPPAGITANDQGYVIDFQGDDPYGNPSVFVDARTGESHVLGASEYAKLLPTLKPV